ncbi:hypothetical protein [Gemmata sp.]|uniref:hypothetical protein n=1 Tax=Gemmata sp. TaxID=1914242 RepID=UPI003F6EC49E
MAHDHTPPAATPGDTQDELRGGTQGGNRPPANVGMPAGGTNSLSATGGSHPSGGAVEHGRGTRSDSRGEPQELFEGSRRPSPAVAKERARDAADVDTTHGFPAAPGNPRQLEETDPQGTGQSTPLESRGVEVTKASLGEKGVGEHK